MDISTLNRNLAVYNRNRVTGNEHTITFFDDESGSVDTVTGNTVFEFCTFDQLVDHLKVHCGDEWVDDNPNLEGIAHVLKELTDESNRNHVFKLFSDGSGWLEDGEKEIIIPWNRPEEFTKKVKELRGSRLNGKEEVAGKISTLTSLLRDLADLIESGKITTN